MEEVFTVCANADEVLLKKLRLPPYLAVMECVPMDNVEVLMEATPEFNVALPSDVEPSRNCTVPTGVPLLLLTVAASVSR